MNTEEKSQVENLEVETVETIEKATEIPTLKAGFDWKLLSFTLSAFIIGASLVATAFYHKEQQKKYPSENLTPEEEEMVWTPPHDVGVQDVTREEFEEEDINSSEQPEIKLVVEEYEILVDWSDRPVEVESGINFSDMSRLYTVGTVTNGPLQGEVVYLVYSAGMGMDYPEGLFVHPPRNITSIAGENVFEITGWIDEVANLPESISSTDNKIQLKKDGELFAALVDIEDMSEWSKETIDTLTFDGLDSIYDEKLYTYNQCLFARTPSDLVVEYIIDIPFIDAEDQGSYSTPEISYNRIDGDRMTGEYEIYDRVAYGCGSLCSPLKVVDRNDNEFIKTGVADDGSELYVLKNIYDQRYNELYTQKNTRAFIDTSDGQYNALNGNKYTYEDFIGIVPLLYWKDSFDRWVEFVNTEFIILAEKCKPVIYLYPEEKTDLHVEVKPNNGFTKTIPEYKNGWSVTAYPDGRVIDKETGDEYEYLYWAGLVDGYPLIEEGWVVAHRDLPAFFDYYLPRYGLQGAEITDFMEYWIEEMNKAPYYAVSFVEQSIINELSPLSIDKDPDIVVRVHMTARPLERPIKLDPPRLPIIPERRGFTVAEWGGTILR